MIYFLDNDPKLSATYLSDKHISPLLCNTCTVLCTVLHNNGITIPQKTFNHHTLVDWASVSKSNFEWLRDYAIGLSEAFELRYGRKHQTSIDLNNIPVPEELPKVGLTEFPQMIPDRFKLEGNSVEAYRNYYVHEKAKVCNYRKEPPAWFIDKLNDVERTLWIDFFEQFNCSLRLYRDKKEGVVIQKQIDSGWVTSNRLSLEEQVLIERILDVNKG